MSQTQITCPNRIALRADKKEARPYEVGAMATMFEKSATKLKLKLKLLKCTKKKTKKTKTQNANSDIQR